MKRREFLKFLGAGAAAIAAPEILADSKLIPETRNPAEIMREILTNQGADIDHSKFDEVGLWLDSPAINVGDIININGKTMRVTSSSQSDTKQTQYSVVKYSQDVYDF